MTNITTDPEIANLCQALKEHEKAQLEENLKSEGCRDALVLWGDVLLDGHNRLEICKEHDIEFATVQAPGIETREQAVNWVINNQLGRRNLSPTEASYLRGKRYNAEKLTPFERNRRVQESRCQNGTYEAEPAQTAKRLSSELGVGARGIIRDGQFAAAIDTISQNVGQDVARAIRTGEAKLTKTQVKKIASAPPKEQKKEFERAKDAKKMRSSAAVPSKPRKPKGLQVVHDSDHSLAEQVCSLLHRLNEVAGKIEPETLYRKFPDGLRHNLDQALSGASFFVSDLHRCWANDRAKKNAAG